MLQWLSAFWGDIVVLMVLGVIVGAVIGNMFRSSRKGSGCGCGSCKGCSMAGTCHGHQE